MDDRRDAWRHGVDENLAALNAGQRVWERDLGVIRKLLADIDRLLRGDIENGTSGLQARLELIEQDLAKINAVLFMDPTGKTGLIHEVKLLASGERTAGERWKFAAVVVAAILSLFVSLWTNRERVGDFLKPEPAAKVSRKAKRPKTQRIIIREVPADPQPPEELGTNP